MIGLPLTIGPGISAGPFLFSAMEKNACPHIQFTIAPLWDSSAIPAAQRGRRPPSDKLLAMLATASNGT